MSSESSANTYHAHSRFSIFTTWYTILYMYRYLARVVLVPFAYKPPNIRVDELDALLEMAPAYIPDIIKVINTLTDADPDLFYSMMDIVKEALGDSSIDPRLLAQYATSLVCAQEVCSYNMIIMPHRIFSIAQYCQCTQIVKIANVQDITPQAVIDNFEAVTVPAIKQWQVVRHPEGLTKDELIGDLLLKLAESVNHVSEV